MILKIIFILAGIAGVVAIFYVSWFWRALIVPMIILLFADVAVSFWNRLRSKEIKARRIGRL